MATSFGLSLMDTVETDCDKAPPTHNVTTRDTFSKCLLCVTYQLTVVCVSHMRLDLTDKT